MLRGTLNISDASATARTDISLETTAGIKGLGASENHDSNLSLDDARPQFSKLKVSASRQQMLWSNLDLFISAAGQLADGTVPSSEEFTLGGAKFGRAFDYGELSGDEGWAASLEVRYTMDGSILSADKIQMFGYADFGEIWNAGASPSGYPHAELSSAGAGLRVSILPGVFGTLEWASPLSNDVATSHQTGSRFFFSISWSL